LNNILIDEKGTPIICDFGLARSLDDNLCLKDIDSPGGNLQIYLTHSKIKVIQEQERSIIQSNRPLNLE